MTDRKNEGNLTPLPKPPDKADSNGTMPNMSSVFALGEHYHRIGDRGRGFETIPKQCNNQYISFANVILRTESLVAKMSAMMQRAAMPAGIPKGFK